MKPKLAKQKYTPFVPKYKSFLLYIDIPYMYQTSQSELQIGTKEACNVKILVEGSCINIFTMQYIKIETNKIVVKKLQQKQIGKTILGLRQHRGKLKFQHVLLTVQISFLIIGDPLWIYFYFK